MKIEAVILAAGEGKRMRSKLPKVLHKLAGKPLIEHVIETAQAVCSQPPIVIYGHQGQLLQQMLKPHDIRLVEQTQQLGTGHALQQALPLLADDDQVLVLYGDVPLLSLETLNKLITTTPKNAIGMLTVQLTNPYGYGRIKRDSKQHIIGIVEEKDATDAERAITEINSGIYIIPIQYLKKWLPILTNKNAQGEYYLTDIIAHAVKENIKIHAIEPLQKEEVMGVNDCAQLANLERFYQRKAAEKLMNEGITLLDPNRFDLRGELNAGHDVVIDINVIIEGKVNIGDGCVIGANTILRNVTLGQAVMIKENCVIEDANITNKCVIGPFARIRPGTVLAEGVHIGNFVEIKNSRIGTETKINHLSYVGDSEVGKQVNIGAGTITCNYDGMKKYKTIIGDRVQIGSDTTLVAPVTVHDDVYIASATTVRKEVPAGSLVFNTRDEQIREGWTAVKRRKQETERGN